MFQEFYGFTRLPFSRTIATQDLFPTTGQKELSARLTYLVRERGFGLVTGEIGSGKSTAVRAFAASLDFNRYLVIYLANPMTGITGLYRDLLTSLGYEPPFSRPRLVARIRTALDEVSVTKHRAPVVVLDEAHLLTQPMLEQLRLLFSDQMDSQSLATLVLVGTPDLRRMLHLVRP
jgi:type II secretory pathway predicted ATPase ExeA